MTITVLKASDVTAAIGRMMEGDPRMYGVSITRAQEVNERPSGCPWVGIYRTSQQFTPRTLGAGTGAMNHELTMVVVLQAAGGQSGEDCEALLEELVANAASVILGDTSLGGTVLIVKSMEVQYQDYSRVDNVYMQTAALYITAETRVAVS